MNQAQTVHKAAVSLGRMAADGLIDRQEGWSAVKDAAMRHQLNPTERLRAVWGYQDAFDAWELERGIDKRKVAAAIGPLIRARRSKSVILGAAVEVRGLLTIAETHAIARQMVAEEIARG